MIKAGELFVIEGDKDEDVEYTLMGEGTIIRAQIFHDGMEGDVGPEVIPEEKASFEDFKQCIFLANTQFRGAKYIIKKLKNTWYDEALSTGIKKVEKFYLTSLVFVLGVLALGIIAVNLKLSAGITIGVMMAWILADCLLISPLIYMPFMPKPIKKHIKDVNKLTPYEQRVRAAELGINETAEKVLKKYKNTKKCIKYITVVTFLAIVTLLGLICDVILDAPSFLFAALPATTVVGGIIAYLIRSFLYKKFEITETGLSPEQKIYRRKHIKTTAIILVIVTLVAFLLPFIFAWHETSTHTIYSFPDGVGYQYDSEEEAEREYYKLKGYVTGEKTLYKITYEDYSDETKEYILYIVPSGEKFEYDNGVYNLTSTEFKNEEVLYFKTEEEAEKFKDENILDDENEYNASRRNLLFDDETLSVSYQLHNETIFSRVCDNLPVFIIIASCAFIIVFIASIAVYVKNKNKLK